MYNVLIVDDEMLIRVGIQASIEWEKHGFRVVALAEDGKDALEKFKENTIDLIITDIMMPEMDGLELIREVRKIDRDVKFVFLSCHNEFNFVREALKLGADDYILKLSMDSDDLLKIVLKIKEDLDKINKNKNGVFVGAAWIEDIFQKYIGKVINYDTLIKEIQNSNLNFMAPYYAIYISIDRFIEYKNYGEIQAENLLNFSFKNIISELSKEINNIIIDIYQGGFIFLASNINNTVDWHEFVKEINRALKIYLNLTCTFVVSNSFFGLEQLPDIVKNSQEYLEYRFYRGEASILELSKVDFVDEIVKLDTNTKQEMLINLRTLNFTKFEYVFKEHFNKLIFDEIYLPSRVKLFALELVYIYSDIAYVYDVPIEDILNQQIKPYDKISKYETIYEVIDSVLEFVKILMDKLMDKKIIVEREEIIKARMYVLENLENDINLDLVSNYCNISKTYFSALFKKETGENFNDYVNRIKMEEAHKLIIDYDMKIADASSKVGIYDLSYFSKIFKRYTGISPSKAKKS